MTLISKVICKQNFQGSLHPWKTLSKDILDRCFQQNALDNTFKNKTPMASLKSIFSSVKRGSSRADLAEIDSGISTERFRRFFISTAVPMLSSLGRSTVLLLFPQSRETLRTVEKVESCFRVEFLSS